MSRSAHPVRGRGRRRGRGRGREEGGSGGKQRAPAVSRSSRDGRAGVDRAGVGREGRRWAADGQQMEQMGSRCEPKVAD